jgi:hypothetical protein
MDQSTISKPDIKPTICEASGCSEYATTEVNIRVGDLGTINLLLCENCKSKFSDPKSGERERISESHSNESQSRTQQVCTNSQEQSHENDS